MTNEEAARILEYQVYKWSMDWDEREDGLSYCEAIEKAIAALRNKPNGEPLTLEQLREMDGKPAYWPEDDSWGVISVSDVGIWANIPLFRGRKNGINFEYSTTSRKIKLYAYPPAHIDREAWEPCGACKDGNVKINIPEFHAMAICNQHMDHEAFTLTLQTRFCPVCGRPLTPEAWAELEKRVRG